MDPRNRLWSELIFSRCNLNDLLALRAVCRSLRDQLNALHARLWSQALLDVRRMTCAERQLGWRGVACAWQRERVTRANCDAGVFAAGAVLTRRRSPYGAAFFCVAGRIVAIDDETVQVFDADSGALVVTHAVSYPGVVRVVQDRWMVFTVRHVAMFVLDCTNVRVTTYAPPDVRGRLSVLSVSGARVMHTSSDAPGATVLHISADAEDATVVRVVAHVKCGRGETVELCQRGRSILRVDGGNRLLLCSVVTGSIIRTFDPPEEHIFRYLIVFDSRDFVGAFVDSYVTGGWRSAMVVLRLSDGASSAPFTSFSVQPVIVDGGRLHVPSRNFADDYALVDAATLAVSELPDMANLWVDHSGALLWRRGGPLMAASAFVSRGTAVRTANLNFNVVDFSYGVAVVRDGTTCRV